MRIISSLLLAVAMITFLPTADAQASCELTPINLPLFDGTPVAELTAPIATPATEVLSHDEATEILEMYAACTNTGDPTLVWAMFTPRWFSAQFADSSQHYLPAFEFEIATGHDDVVNPLALERIDEIILMDDGRISITATFSSGSMEWTDNLLLVNVDGQWLIDDVEPVLPES